MVIVSMTQIIRLGSESQLHHRSDCDQLGDFEQIT